MVLGVLSFLFGVLLLQQFSALPEISWCWALFFFFFIPLLPPHLRNIILFMLGFLWALLRAHWVLDVALPSELQGKDILVTGVIASIPVEDDRKQRFEFDIESLEFNKKSQESIGKVRISWYAKRGKGKQKTDLKAGQRWQFWLRLKQPHGFMNPGGFDYESWLYQQKIRATGYVRINTKKKQFAKKIDDEVSGYNMLILRQNLYEKLKRVTSKTEYGGILVALAMGERRGISPAQWQVFRATGTSHLVAISGLHIGLLAGFVFFIVRRLWPYCGSAALLLASPRAAALIALLMAAFYAALSGFAVPAQRALLMLSIVMLSIFQRHKVQSTQVLSLALLLVLLLDPVAVLSAGFWLSFSAVAIISFAALGRLHIDNNGIDKNWRVWGRLQWRISLALIPLLLFLFQQASLVSPLTNLIAIPVVSFIVVPLVLFATGIIGFLPDVASLSYFAADSVLSALWWFLAYLGNSSLSQWHGVKPEILPLLIAMMGFILLLTPKSWPAKYLGIFLILPLLWPKSNSPLQGDVEITLLDVGQGLSAVVQTQKHALVFDTGPKFSPSFDTGAAVVIPYIRQKNIKKLDMLILSHKDNDHRGGLGSIQKEIEINKLISSYGEKGSERCFQGQTWTWDGVLFEMLNPDQSLRYKKRNNSSCVLRVSAGKESLLLSADIEKKTEARLVQQHLNKLNSTYLVAPHHGSKTSSSQAFLQAVQPKYIMIPVGFKNRYRMPHDSVLQRYLSNKIKVLETSKVGAITIKFGQNISTSTPIMYRLQAQKYWNSRH